MKIKISSLSAFAVFAAAALGAQGQTASFNDIVVGFLPAEQLFDWQLEIKAGSVSTLESYTTQTLIGNFNTSLTATAASWATSTNPGQTGLYWGAVGVNTGSNVFATSGWGDFGVGTLGTQSTTHTWNNLVSGQVSGAATQIIALNNGFNNRATGHAVATGDGLSVTLPKATADRGPRLEAREVPDSNVSAEQRRLIQAASVLAALPDGSDYTVYSAMDLYSVSASSSQFSVRSPFIPPMVSATTWAT